MIRLLLIQFVDVYGWLIYRLKTSGEESNDNIHHRTIWNLWFSIDFLQFRILKSDLKVNCVLCEKWYFCSGPQCTDKEREKSYFSLTSSLQFKDIDVKRIFRVCLQCLGPRSTSLCSETWRPLWSDVEEGFGLTSEPYNSEEPRGWQESWPRFSTQGPFIVTR
jgi:hypothetical protein